jgi:hypothetical protein
MLITPKSQNHGRFSSTNLRQTKAPLLNHPSADSLIQKQDEEVTFDTDQGNVFRAITDIFKNDEIKIAPTAVSNLPPRPFPKRRDSVN